MNPLLTGIRILDLTRLLPGPFCTLYLAQLGAEVIKIEEPAGATGVGGDYARQMLPDVFEQVNRGKRSVALDLRNAEHIEVFLRMVKTADVVVESFRPGVMDKLGCGYPVLKGINPRLVYAAITGYGQTGPYRDLAGHDVNYLCYAGILDQIGPADAAPALANVQIADLAGGSLTGAIGILAAVMGARASGEGAFVDVAMLDAALALQVVGLSSLNTRGEVAPRGRDMLTGALPNYRLYLCADGGYMAVGALEPKFLAILLKLVGAEVAEPLAEELKVALADYQSGEHGEKLGAALTAVFASKDRDFWRERLAATDACTSPVLNLAEALSHEQVKAREMVVCSGSTRAFQLPIRFDFPLKALEPSPALGAHNNEFL